MNDQIRKLDAKIQKKETELSELFNKIQKVEEEIAILYHKKSITSKLTAEMSLKGVLDVIFETEEEEEEEEEEKD